MKTRGFTLIEMMIVVTIIAILAAIALPKFIDISMKAKAAAIVADTRLILAAAQHYHADHGHYPPDGWWGEVPDGLEDYLPGDFSFSRHESWTVLYSFDNMRYPKAYPSYAKRFGMWVSVSVWTNDQQMLNFLMSYTPGYLSSRPAVYGTKRVSAVVEAYVN
jgi:prepilin-type N-terminal cleavage/methylation domain-containing protein